MKKIIILLLISVLLSGCGAKEGDLSGSSSKATSTEKAKEVTSLIVSGESDSADKQNSTFDENVSSSQNSDSTEKESPDFLEQISYSNSELIEICQFDKGYKKMLEEYPTDSVFSHTNKNRTVIYHSETQLAFLLFNDKEIKIFNKIYDKSDLTADRFDDSLLGKHVNEMLDFDKKGQYMFLHTGVNYPRTSTHYTKDRYAVYVNYNEDMTVKDISKEKV